MGNVVQAFGVFSRFRNEDRPGGFGLDSFLDDHTALFYKGGYYVMLYAPEKNPDSLKQFAKLVSSKISDPSSPPKEISFFPKRGLKSGSIQYFSEGLLGHQFLKSGFQGTYVDGEKEHTLFLAIFKDSQEAEGTFKIYNDAHYHRLHHGIGVGHEGRARGCNFAPLFPLWDLLFGPARFAPDYPATGIRDQLDGVDYGAGFVAQQWLGFKRLAANLIPNAARRSR